MMLSKSELLCLDTTEVKKIYLISLKFVFVDVI